MNSYLKHLEKTFVEQGGIKERMYAARTGYRQQQDEKMKGIEKEIIHLRSENERLRTENASLSALAAQWKACYDGLRTRTLAAYNLQQEEIMQLKQRLGEKLQ